MGLIGESSWGLLRRGLYKLIIGPIRYRGSDGYDARRYWGDRFSQSGLSLRGSGHEGLSEPENAQVYRERATLLTDILARMQIDLPSTDVLEVGCGTGFYANLLSQLGVRSYVGSDVTDVLFTKLQPAYPGFRFSREDITENAPEDKFDLVLMIDVLQHIVDRDKALAALVNARGALRPEGVLLVGPLVQGGNRRLRLFYVKWWSLEELAKVIPDSEVGEPKPFVGGYLLPIRHEGFRWDLGPKD